MIELFGHPFSSYTWKALIALYENNTAFHFRKLDADCPDNIQRLQTLSPQHKFPLLVEENTCLFESSVIIEYLQLRHPGETIFIPANPDDALQVRMLDRFFDCYVMTPVQAIVNDFMREPDKRDPVGVEHAQDMLKRSYQWLNTRLSEGDQPYLGGKPFCLVDCAAAPSLFYADWLVPLDSGLSALQDYRGRLLQRPSVKRCVDEARPFRYLFPPGAPDRD